MGVGSRRCKTGTIEKQLGRFSTFSRRRKVGLVICKAKATILSKPALLSSEELGRAHITQWPWPRTTLLDRKCSSMPRRVWLYVTSLSRRARGSSIHTYAVVCNVLQVSLLCKCQFGVGWMQAMHIYVWSHRPKMPEHAPHPLPNTIQNIIQV